MNPHSYTVADHVEGHGDRADHLRARRAVAGGATRWPLNEVWFDDLDDLRARISFFEEVGIGGAADLVREATFLAVREDPSRPFWSAKRPLGVPFR